MHVHRTVELMGAMKSWATIATAATDVAVEPDPHRASAMVRVDGRWLVSSVLPWRSSGDAWEGDTLAAKQRLTLDALREHLDEVTIWRGDWNQALEGRE